MNYNILIKNVNSLIINLGLINKNLILYLLIYSVYKDN